MMMNDKFYKSAILFLHQYNQKCQCNKKLYKYQLFKCACMGSEKYLCEDCNEKFLNNRSKSEGYDSKRVYDFDFRVQIDEFVEAETKKLIELQDKKQEKYKHISKIENFKDYVEYYVELLTDYFADNPKEIEIGRKDILYWEDNITNPNHSIGIKMQIDKFVFVYFTINGLKDYIELLGQFEKFLAKQKSNIGISVGGSKIIPLLSKEDKQQVLDYIYKKAANGSNNAR